MSSLVRITYPDGKMPPLTDAQINEIEDAASRPIVYDNDCPKLTKEQLKQFRRVHGEKRKEAVV